MDALALALFPKADPARMRNPKEHVLDLSFIRALPGSIDP